MESLQQIQAAILELSDEELKQLSEWLLELQWERSDRKLEEMVKAGKLGKFAEDAREEMRAGRTTPL